MVAVIRRLLPTVWEDVVRSLVNGGIHILEVTMDAADAPKQMLKLIHYHYQDNSQLPPFHEKSIFYQNNLKSHVESI